MDIKNLKIFNKKTAFHKNNKNLVPDLVENKIKRMGGDVAFIEKIAPDLVNPEPEDYVIVENGYLSTLHVHGIKEYVEYWYLRDFSSYQNTTWALFTENGSSTEAIKRANRKYIEAVSNLGEVHTPEKILEAQERAKKAFDKIRETRQNLKSLKNVTVKILFFSPSLNQLLEERDKAKTDLTTLGYSVSLHSGFQYEEYRSFSLPLTHHPKLEKKQELNNEQIAHGSPFDKVSLLDDNGSLIGETANGLVVFDMNHVDSFRKQPTMAVFGQPRFGKSYMIKTILEDLLAKGTFVRLFFFTDEYFNILRAYNAAIVSPFSGDESINVFQVFDSATDEATGQVKEYESFTGHIKKLLGLFKAMSPGFNNEASSDDASNLSLLLWLFYQNWGILKLKADAKSESDIEPITTLPIEAYPLAEDFLQFLNQNIDAIRKNYSLSNFDKSLEKIAGVLNLMTTIHAPLFNSYTKTTYRPETQLVAFDLRDKDSMTKDVFDAQFYSVLQSIWSDAIKHGIPEKKAYIEGKKTLEEVERFVVVMDEVQEYLNPTMEYAITTMNNFIKELAKFWAGVIFITPSPKQFFPDEASYAAASEMNQIFNSCTYKFFFKANQGDVQIYQKHFSNTLSASQLEQMVNFEVGDAYMVIGDAKALKIHVLYDEEKATFYAGGV